MTVENLVWFLSVYLVLCGLWRFVYLLILTKSYSYFKNDGESFIDYCVREINTFSWRLRKRFRIDWFYNSKLFRFFQILFGLFQVVIAFALLYIVSVVKSTDYKVFLDINLW